MNLETLNVHIKGAAGLLMHNPRLADPMNEWSKGLKAISAKRKKTDDDYMEMSRLEFFGGLYYSKDLGPYVPARALHAVIVEGAKVAKLGKQFKAGMFVYDDAPLIYSGPKDAEKMWESGGFHSVDCVRVGTARVMRTRPMFRPWELKFQVIFAKDVLDRRQVQEALEVAGRLKGLLDGRPVHGGRFSVEALTEA